MSENNPTRKHIRLTGFNYSNSASYFITICTANRKNIFWKTASVYALSSEGQVVDRCILEIPNRFALTVVDKYVIMPDHVHLIITLLSAMPDDPTPTPDIKNIIGGFKAKVTKEIGQGQSIWQHRFYDHVIRNDKEYSAAWDYVNNNPYIYLDKLKHTPESI